jgi:hypothetical protein
MGRVDNLAEPVLCRTTSGFPFGPPAAGSSTTSTAAAPTSNYSLSVDDVEGSTGDGGGLHGASLAVGGVLGGILLFAAFVGLAWLLRDYVPRMRG